MKDTIVNTRKYLNEIKGINNEFYLLKGLLLATFLIDRKERNFDVSLIAQRMDKIDAENKERLISLLED